jgi:chaperonin cofactor prefoldin
MISWLFNKKYALAAIRNDIELLKKRVEALEAKFSKIETKLKGERI